MIMPLTFKVKGRLCYYAPQTFIREINLPHPHWFNLKMGTWDGINLFLLSGLCFSKLSWNFFLTINYEILIPVLSGFTLSGLFLGPFFSDSDDFLTTVHPVWQFSEGSYEDGEMIQNHILWEITEGNDAWRRTRGGEQGVRGDQHSCVQLRDCHCDHIYSEKPKGYKSRTR